MPDNEHSDGGRELQILRPLGESPDDTDRNLARDKSLSWTHRTDDEKAIIIDGEVILGSLRRRTFVDWLAVGHAIYLLEAEVADHAGAPAGRKYNRYWAALASEQIRQTNPSIRTHAKWLWVNRAAVQLWWDGVDGGDRDRWNNPATIRIQYEKAHPPAVTGTLPELEERTEPRAPFFSVSHGEVIGRQIGELDSVIDRVDDRLGGAATRITDLVREYDLSSPAKAAESARNFWLRYHEAEAGPQGIKWFIEALQAIVGDEEQFPPTPPSATGNGNGNPPPTTGPRGNGHRPPMRRGN